MSAVTDFLRVLITPRCWIRLYDTSALWDAEVRRLMAAGSEVRPIGEYRAMLGPHEVWIENHPYASIRLEPVNVLPRRATSLAAMDYIRGAIVRQQIAEATK